jgi:hypothetical protein
MKVVAAQMFCRVYILPFPFTDLVQELFVHAQQSFVVYIEPFKNQRKIIHSKRHIKPPQAYDSRGPEALRSPKRDAAPVRDIDGRAFIKRASACRQQEIRIRPAGKARFDCWEQIPSTVCTIPLYQKNILKVLTKY